MEHDERRKARIYFQTTYARSNIKGSFEDEWTEHLQDLLAMAEEFEADEEERIDFLRFSLRGDASKFYIALNYVGKPSTYLYTALGDRYKYEE